MAVVGEASIRIVADLSKLSAEVESKLKELESNADKIGKNMADKMAAGFKSRSQTNFIDIGANDGDLYATSFADRMQANLMRRMPQIGKQMGDSLGEGIASNAAAKINTLGDRTDLTASGKKAGEQWKKGMGEITPPSVKPKIETGRGRGGGGGDSGDDAGKSFGSRFWDGFEKMAKNRRPAPFEGIVTNLLQNFVQLSSMAAGMTGLVAAVSSLASAVVSLGAAAAQGAAGFLAMGNIFGALMQGMMVLKSVFGGVGAAIGALNNAQKAARQSSIDLAERALQQARARLNLKQAILQEGRAQEDALKRIADAQREYEDALKGEQDAQENLDDARKNAAERIEDLQLALEDAALNEERGVLNLKKAEKALRQARAGGNANAIYEADLAYREQELSLRKLKESNGDLRDEANKAFAEGVDGNEEVKDAQEDVKDAALAVVDALREMQRAQEDAPLAIEDASLRVKEAAKALQDALKPPENNAIEAVNEAMSELSPAAQKFARYWQGTVQPILKDIKKAGQEQFFPGLQRGVQALLDSQFDEILGEMFVGTSKVLGDFSEKLLKTFAEPENLGSLQTIFTKNTEILEILGRAATKLVKPFLQIGEALAPFAKNMAERWEVAAGKFADFINKAKETGDLTKFFSEAETKMLAIKEMFKAFGPGLKEVFLAALPAADTLIKGITDMGTAWSGTFDQTKKDDMALTFQGAADNALKILGAVSGIGGWFFDMGANPGIGKIADAFDRIVPKLEDAANAGFDQVADDIVRIVDGLGGFATAVAESKSLEVFFGAISWALVGIGTALEAIAGNKAGKVLIIVVTGLLGMAAAISFLIGMVALALGGLKKFRETLANIGGAIPDRFKRKKEGGEGEEGPADVTAASDDMQAAATTQSSDAKKAGNILGTALGMGIADGIAETRENVRKAANELAAIALAEVAKVWGAHSDADETEELGNDFINGIVNTIKSRTQEVVNAVVSMADQVSAALKGELKADGVGKAATDKISSEFEAGKEPLNTKAKSVASGAADAMKSVGPEFEQAGKTADDNYAEGLKKAQPTVIDAAAETGGKAGAAADATGKATGKAAGENTSAGFINGITSRIKAVFTSGKRVTKTVEGGMGDGGTGAGARDVMKDNLTSLAEGGVAASIMSDKIGHEVEDNFEDALKGKKKRNITRSLFTGLAGVAGFATAGLGLAQNVLSVVQAENPLLALGSLAGVDLSNLGQLGPTDLTVNNIPQVDVSSLVTSNAITNATSNINYNMSGTTLSSGMAAGGMVGGIYRGGDTVPAILTPGEYVLTRDMVAQIGAGRLEAWRRGSNAPVTDDDPELLDAIEELKRLMKSGMSSSQAIAAMSNGVQHFAKGGLVKGRYRGADTELALVTPGEYVLTPQMVRALKLSYLEMLRKKKITQGDTLSANMSAAAGIPSGFPVGGAGMPDWLTDPNMGVRSDINVNNIPLLTDWADREFKRLLAYYFAQNKFEEKYRTQFETALKEAIAREQPIKDAQQNAIIEALKVKESQQKLLSLGVPTAALDGLARDILPPVSGMYQKEFSYEPDVFGYDAMGRIATVAGDDAAAIQEAANYIQHLGAFDEALTAAYIKARAEAILAAAPPVSDGGGGGGTTGGGTTGGGETEAERLARLEAERLARERGEQATQTGKNQAAKQSATDAWYASMKDLERKGFINAANDAKSTGKQETSNLVGKHFKGYGPWRYPLLQRFRSTNWKGHNPNWAVDIMSPQRNKVVAVQQGVLTTSKYLVYPSKKYKGGYGGYGNYVKVMHDDGTASLYAHLYSRVATVGKRIASGDPIGTSGDTGGTTGPHLHFELYRNRDNPPNINSTHDLMEQRGIPRVGTRLTGIGTWGQGSSAKAPGGLGGDYWRRRKGHRFGGPRVGLAEGGVVQATPGGISALIAEGGRDERVTPLDQQGRSAAEVEMLGMVQTLLSQRSSGRLEIVNHIYPAPGMNERLLAEQVSKEIMFARRKLS